MPLSRIAARMQFASCYVTTEDFTMIYADVEATETRSADDIISEISNVHEEDSSDDDEEEAVLPIPTSAETTSPFDCLLHAFECNSDVPHDCFKQLQEMKQFLVTGLSSELKQKRVTDFFSGK